MFYYRVKKEYDQKMKNPSVRNGDIYIAGELYTKKQVEKQHLDLAYLEPLEIPRNQTYFCFGARFWEQPVEHE